MVGRFVSHEGTERNAPVVRFGTIAMMPGEPIRQERGFDQESYLVECRSLPGFSGSPVFVYMPSGFAKWSTERKEKSGQTPRSSRGTLSHDVDIQLLGLDWGHIRDHIVEGPFVYAVNTGMCGVVPAWKIADVLNHERLAAARREIVLRL